MPGLLLIALGVIGVVGIVAAMAYQRDDLLLTLGSVAGGLLIGGGLLIMAEHHRVRRVERNGRNASGPPQPRGVAGLPRRPRQAAAGDYALRAQALEPEFLHACCRCRPASRREPLCVPAACSHCGRRRSAW